VSFSGFTLVLVGCGHCGLVIESIFVTPHVQKLLIWPSSARGMGLHTRGTSLTLSSSLHVKRLTQRCYVWNDKAYKLAPTLLNF
jgi:hypothetical protein